MRLVLIGLLLLLGVCNNASAQHSIDIQRKAADGDFMAALAMYDKMPKKVVTTAAQIAAARSAWALGLSDRALEEFDKALRQGNLPTRDQAQAHLSKGIIRFQEGQPQLAILEIEKALPLLTQASPLRGQVYALWGDSLASMKQYAKAIERYEAALEECEYSQAIDVHYHFGEALMTLGKFEEARQHFEKIPLKHERAAQAIRRLMEVAMEVKNFASAGFWAAKGREEFSDNFLDSWVDYVMVRSAIEAKDKATVDELRKSAEKRYAPSDPWLALLSATVEEYEWQGGTPNE